jgi:hypothetical protein
MEKFLAYLVKRWESFSFQYTRCWVICAVFIFNLVINSPGGVIKNKIKK